MKPSFANDPAAPIINIIIIITTTLLAIAFYTLRERKLLGYLQYRKGPNKPTIAALTIPITDAGKLFSKQEKLTTLTNIKHYYIAPAIIIILALLL